MLDRPLSIADLATWIALVLLLAWTYLSAPLARRVTAARESLADSASPYSGGPTLPPSGTIQE